MNKTGGCLVLLIVIAVGLGLALVGGALVVGVAGAMFLDTPWKTGWHEAWDNLGYLFLFSLIFLPVLASFGFSRD